MHNYKQPLNTVIHTVLNRYSEQKTMCDALLSFARRDVDGGSRGTQRRWEHVHPHQQLPLTHIQLKIRSVEQGICPIATAYNNGIAIGGALEKRVPDGSLLSYSK